MTTDERVNERSAAAEGRGAEREHVSTTQPTTKPEEAVAPHEIRALFVTLFNRQEEQRRDLDTLKREIAAAVEKVQILAAQLEDELNALEIRCSDRDQRIEPGTHPSDSERRVPDAAIARAAIARAAIARAAERTTRSTGLPTLTRGEDGGSRTLHGCDTTHPIRQLRRGERSIEY